MFCPKCGTQVPAGVKFCPNCGSALGGSEAKRAETGGKTKEASSGKKSRKRGIVFLAAAAGAAVLAVLGAAAVWKLTSREAPQEDRLARQEAESAVEGAGQSAALSGAAGTDGLGSSGFDGADLEGSGDTADSGDRTETGPEPQEVQEETRNMHDELEAERAGKVEALYEQRLLLQEAVRTAVAEEIENTALVRVDPKEQFSFQEVLIDEATGSPIVSEGVKEFLQAATEGKSVQDMCRAALNGGMSEIPDYLAGTIQSSLKDEVISLIGADIFTPLDTISKWMNPDKEPTVLLQGIVEEQQKDVSVLLLFMQQEDFGAADIYKIAQVSKAVEQRVQEISAAQGGIRENIDQAYLLGTLADQYADTEAQLEAYGETVLPDAVPELGEEEKEAFESLRAEAEEELARYELLYTLDLGNIYANYDVEGFREAQAGASYIGMMADAVFGEWVGGAITNSQQEYVGTIQENRRALCDLLTDSMEESYVETVVVREAFVRAYSLLSHFSQAEDEDLYFAELYMQGREWKEELEDAAKAYASALSRYTYDLDSVIILYNCILTEQQAGYLFDLQLESDYAQQALETVDLSDSEYQYGYSSKEGVERWNRLVDSYVESVAFLVERRAVSGEAPGFHSNKTREFGGMTYKDYTKEFTEDSRPVLVIGGGVNYYYDMNGRLICIDSNLYRITQREYMLLSYQSKAEGAELKTIWDTEDSPELQSMSDLAGKAEEVYTHFWGGN